MKLTPGLIFLICSVAVAASFVAAKLSGCITADELSAIYTGLGFAGLLATFFHEREEAADRDQEQAKLFMQMRAQSKATCHAARVTALAAELAHWTDIKHKFTRDTGSEGDQAAKRRETMNQRITLLEKQLEQACETTEIM